MPPSRRRATRSTRSIARCHGVTGGSRSSASWSTSAPAGYRCAPPRARRPWPHGSRASNEGPLSDDGVSDLHQFVLELTRGSFAVSPAGRGAARRRDRAEVAAEAVRVLEALPPSWTSGAPVRRRPIDAVGDPLPEDAGRVPRGRRGPSRRGRRAEVDGGSLRPEAGLSDPRRARGLREPAARHGGRVVLLIVPELIGASTSARAAFATTARCSTRWSTTRPGRAGRASRVRARAQPLRQAALGRQGERHLDVADVADDRHELGRQYPDVS